MATVEVVEGETAEKMPMRRIRKCVSAREMRNGNLDGGAVPTNPVQLFHGANDIGQMLDDVEGVDLLETIRRKRPWANVQIVDDVRRGGRSAIEVDRADTVLPAAPEIQRLR